MNLKLEFININEEDVIATSGEGTLCYFPHEGGYLTRTGNFDTDNGSFRDYGAEGPIWVFKDADNTANTDINPIPSMGSEGDTTIYGIDGSATAFTSPSTGMYYHYVNITGTKSLYLCNDPAHQNAHFPAE